MLLAPGNGPPLHVFQLIVSKQCINERHFLQKHLGYMELHRKHSSYTRPFSGQVRFLVQQGVQVATWRRQAPPTSSSVCSIASRNGPKCPETNAGQDRDALRPAFLWRLLVLHPFKANIPRLGSIHVLSAGAAIHKLAGSPNVIIHIVPR
ncbi:hypothetical protein J3459_010302 [Metarhizium acridum]|nr:hypothetical protein J3459_010302 [Metarhizium acridum]